MTFNAPRVAAHQRQAAVEMQEETRAFCEGLGMAVGGSSYKRCEQGVSSIRATQERRTSAELAGML
jgi:hypothetical protein